MNNSCTKKIIYSVSIGNCLLRERISYYCSENTVGTHKKEFICKYLIVYFQGRKFKIKMHIIFLAPG